MNKVMKTLLGVCATLFLAEAGQAESSLLGARVGAVDVPALAEFYKSAFDLEEINRLDLPGGQVEIMLNFGDTVEEALANTGAQVVIMHRDSDDIDDPIPHIIFDVSDINEAVAAVIEAGGSLLVGPVTFGDTGIQIVFARDPAGNQVEMMQRP